MNSNWNKTLSTALIALFAYTTFGAESRRPNIVFAFADDWGRHASAYAKLEPGGMNDVIHTPNFDRIAREGVLVPPRLCQRAFLHAVSQCTAFRPTFLAHGTRLDLARSGVGWIESRVSTAAARTRVIISARPTKSGARALPTTHPMAPRNIPMKRPEAASISFHRMSRRWSRNGKSIAAAKQELYDEVTANFSAFLADRKPGEPFCYWFGPTQAHRKWTQGSGKALWGIDPDSLKGKLPPFLPDVPVVREDLADYFGEVQSFDAALGVLLAKLEEIGELDNTLIVVSGDHGAPGFPHGKCHLYDFGTGVPLAVRWGGAKGGRVVDDLISLTDLAPTFLELGGVKVPSAMTGRSLVKILQSPKSGQVESQRDAVFTGRERHVENARAGMLPYPQRAIRTRDFLYIINFKPDRYPAGDPYRLDDKNPPGVEELTEETRTTLPDEDAGPTKAWLVMHRNDPEWKSFYDLAYGKRPREELYDLKLDPHQVKNVATEPSYAKVRVAT